jgi:hypothetical protein
MSFEEPPSCRFEERSDEAISTILGVPTRRSWETTPHIAERLRCRVRTEAAIFMKRPEILLVNPWIHDFAAYDLWARPMGLLVLATVLRRQGWECRLIDCLDQEHPGMKPINAKPHGHGRFFRSPVAKPAALEGVARTYSRYGVSPEFIREDLRSIPTPAAILVTSLMTYWYPGLRETMELLRECFPGVPIVLGGIYATLLPDHARVRCGPDEVLTGPGEGAIDEALFRLTRVTPRGRGNDGTLEFRPALDLMRKVRFVPVLTSRGCPFRCSYCASARISPRFFRRAPQEVVDEIESTARRHGVEDVTLYDDAFLVDAGAHALPILEMLARRVPGIRLHSPNGLHAAALDRETAIAMKRAGFVTIRIGLERSSDEFHAATGSKTRVRDFLAAVRNLRDAGFTRDRIGVYLLTGLPGQTRSEIEDDVELVLSAGAFPKLAEYSPIPGTRMWPDAVKAGRYPIEEEPLYHNCTLLPAADPSVDAAFLAETRRRIAEHSAS